MNPQVLLELAARWERDANLSGPEDGSPEAERGNRIRQGIREGKRECADALRSLVSIIG